MAAKNEELSVKGRTSEEIRREIENNKNLGEKLVGLCKNASKNLISAKKQFDTANAKAEKRATSKRESAASVALAGYNSILDDFAKLYNSYCENIEKTISLYDELVSVNYSKKLMREVEKNRTKLLVEKNSVLAFASKYNGLSRDITEAVERIKKLLSKAE